jgi:hypothetical protein
MNTWAAQDNGWLLVCYSLEFKCFPVACESPATRRGFCTVVVRSRSDRGPTAKEVYITPNAKCLHSRAGRRKKSPNFGAKEKYQNVKIGRHHGMHDERYMQHRTQNGRQDAFSVSRGTSRAHYRLSHQVSIQETAEYIFQVWNLVHFGSVEPFSFATTVVAVRFPAYYFWIYCFLKILYYLPYCYYRFEKNNWGLCLLDSCNVVNYISETFVCLASRTACEPCLV